MINYNQKTVNLKLNRIDICYLISACKLASWEAIPLKQAKKWSDLHDKIKEQLDAYDAEHSEREIQQMKNPKPVVIDRKSYVDLYTWYKSKIDSIYTWTDLSPFETHKRVERLIYKIEDLAEPEFNTLLSWNDFCYNEEASAIYKH